MQNKSKLSDHKPSPRAHVAANRGQLVLGSDGGSGGPFSIYVRWRQQNGYTRSETA